MPVLIAYIPQEEGFAALDAGIAWARANDDTIIVVNVALEAGAADPTFADEVHLDAVRDKLRREGIDGTVRQVHATADAGPQVVAEAEASGASLVVVGLHRLSPLGKAILGSAAQHVILFAPCPVLSVRAADR